MKKTLDALLCELSDFDYEKPLTVFLIKMIHSQSQDPEAEAHLSEVLAHCAGALVQIGDLLVPFLPNTAESIHATFESGVVKPLDSVLFPKKYIHTPDPHAAKS